MDERPGSGPGEDEEVRVAATGRWGAGARHLEVVPADGGGAGTADPPALRFPVADTAVEDLTRPRAVRAPRARGWGDARTAPVPVAPGRGADDWSLFPDDPTGAVPHDRGGDDPLATDTEDLEELDHSAMDDDRVHDDEGAEEPARSRARGGRGRRATRAPRGGRGPAGSRSSRSAQPGTDRDLPVAIGVGLALAVAAIVAMTIGPAYGVAFATVVVTLCAGELFGAVQKAGHQPATLLGLVATPALVLAAYWRGEQALPVVLVLTVVFTLLWYLVGVSRSAPSTNAGVTILTVTYVGLFGAFAALMLRLPNGTGILLGTVVAVVANDVGALFAGRRFGRSPIARSISPNKTIEGAIGGAAASIAVSFVVLDLIGLHPWESKGGSALALGALVAVLGPIGDLVESMLKRDLAVKDMGSILPGHGGLIDRFDALLFVLPAAYYLCRLLEIA